MITFNTRLIFYGNYSDSPWHQPKAIRKEEFEKLICDEALRSSQEDVQKGLTVFVREILTHPRTMTKLRMRSYGSCRETTLSPLHRLSSSFSCLDEISDGITASIFGYCSISNDENMDLTDETFRFFQWLTYFLGGGNWEGAQDLTRDKNTIEFPYNSPCCNIPALSMYFLVWRCLKQFYPLFINNYGTPLPELSSNNGGLMPFKKRVNQETKVFEDVPESFVTRKKFLDAFGKTVNDISGRNGGFTGYGEAEKLMFNYFLWHVDTISHGMPYSARTASGCNGILTYIKRDLILNNGFTFLEYAESHLKDYPNFNFPSFMLNNFNMKGSISEKLVKLIDRENKKGEKKDDIKKESENWVSV